MAADTPRQVMSYGMATNRVASYSELQKMMYAKQFNNRYNVV